MIFTMNKKITTIDELAVMINKSFEAVESRIGKIEARLTAVESRLDGIEGQMKSFKKYAAERFDSISREFKEVKLQIKAADTRAAVVDVEVRVDKLEREMKLKA
jgi:predicted  nucleic acid-binding Zn-ribbon protein